MIFWAVVSLQAVALILAAWRRPLPRILLALTAFSLADELLVEALHTYLFTDPDHPLRVSVALHGPPALVAYHVETAVVLGWPALLAAAAWRVFAGPQKANGPDCSRPSSLDAHRVVSLGSAEDAARDSPAFRASQRGGPNTMRTARLAVEVIFGAWLIAAGGLAACYPLPRGWTAPVLHAAEVFFVVAALAAIPVGWKRRTIATPEGQAVGLVVVVELVVCVLGAWAWGAKVFDRATWDELARVPYALGWAALIVLLARGATSRPSTSSSTSKSREPMF